MTRALAAVAAAAVAVLTACGETAGTDASVRAAGDQLGGPAAQHRTDGAASTRGGELGLGRDAAEAATVIASAHGLDLVLPAAGALLVAFHEGASAAVELTVEVPARAVLNGTAETSVTRKVRARDLQAMVLPSRRRAATATSAVDVVLPPSIAVRSPVTGTVVEVARYALYGQHEDVRVVIEPDGHPHLRVVVLHVADPTVTNGDRVRAGTTPIAERARSLPVGSQVDRFTVRSPREDPPPHVHVEVRRTG